jgi:cysteine desulfurase
MKMTGTGGLGASGQPDGTTGGGTDQPIYLDHNATTPMLPDVFEAMRPYLSEHFGNPSSSHLYGRRAKEAVERARAQVALLLRASPSEILFTSGGTEANNLAIRGVVAMVPGPRKIVTSTVEHPATAAPCRALEEEGWQVSWLPVDGTGRVRLEDITAALGGGCALVTLMHANNETGSLQPIAEMSRLAHEAGALVHTDAAQSVGKVRVEVDELAVDLLSVAGHKLYAPKGVGVLYVRKGTTLAPVLLGAGHEGGVRPGTENVASIVGLGAACEIARNSLSKEEERVHGLRDLLWELLIADVPGLQLNGHQDARLPNTLNVRFPGARGTQVLEATPRVAASTGSACHEDGEDPSAVLTAMGLDVDTALAAVRLSLGRGTTEDDVRRAAVALIAGWRTVTSIAPGHSEHGR